MVSDEAREELEVLLRARLKATPAKAQDLADQFLRDGFKVFGTVGKEFSNGLFWRLLDLKDQIVKRR